MTKSSQSSRREGSILGPWNRGLGQGANGRQAGGSLPSRSFGPSNHSVRGAGSQLPEQPTEPKRVECRCPRPMTRYEVTTNPNPDCCAHFPPPLLPLGRQHTVNSSGLPSTLDSLRFGWIDCLVLGCMLYPVKPTTTRREPLSMSPSLAADPSPSLLAPSQKVSGSRYFQTTPPRRPGDDQDIDPNTNTWMLIPQHAPCRTRP